MERIRKKISRIGFSLLSPEKIKKISVAKIVTPELYDIDGYPVDGGLMDLRLGTVSPGMRCRTCGGRIKEDLGHPGHIELARPIIHIKYISTIHSLLRGFCHECGSLLASEKDKEKYKGKDLLKKARSAKKCPLCSVPHSDVKLEKPTNFYINKERLTPSEIRRILVNIKDEELKIVGINPGVSFRPEWAILTLFLVPSTVIRPSIVLESGEKSEDDLTHKLSDIVRANQRLWENLNAGAPEVIIEELWDLLQFHITTFFDNSIASIPPARHRSGQPLKTITEKIKSKGGLIRKNLTGKRVNYSARTVVGPEVNMNLNEVGVPEYLAKIVTVSEEVNELNIKKLKKFIENGAVYPGANYITRSDGRKKKITPELKEEILEELEPGYSVSRHLVDGDIVLFNRYPSLHSGSLMAHFVKVLPGRILRLHPAVTLPYNADYDGDEMNIHSLQTEEARAEAKILLNVDKNLMSHKINDNVIGCLDDSITGNYLLSLNNLSKEYANDLLYKIGSDKYISKRGVSGKEFISEILPKIDFENDTIKIKDGKIISGFLNQDSVGNEGGELIKEIDKNETRTKTMKIIKEFFDLGRLYMYDRGISLSIKDLTLSEKVLDKTKLIIAEAEKETEKIIETYNHGKLDRLPGKSLEETRELKILQVLNNVPTLVGKIVKAEILEGSPIDNMIKSGGGGNLLKVAMMACCVGQQALWGTRIKMGYTKRTLSFFRRGELSPRSRGFIKSSYNKGLQPDEFFFGAMTGRDALTDTAIRTAKSGYLYRRLANAFEDIKVEYDGTVRDSAGRIVQFKYGDDGKDVSELHKGTDVTPGESIGLITAQSFGEPSTQMALNVFHMAGVSKMQITSGLPRIIEIFNAKKIPSSPQMKIAMDKEHNDRKSAKILAEKMKMVTVGELSSEISIDFAGKILEVKINESALRSSHKSLSTIIKSLEDLKFKVKEKGNLLKINLSNLNFKEIYLMKEKLKKSKVSGIKGVEEVLVVEDKGNFFVYTLGNNLKDILEMKGVDKDRTYSNDFYEVASILGIEVARAVLIEEIHSVLNSQGLEIDKRHLKFAADVITFSGEVKGVTRGGIISLKDSILSRAAFETPIPQFVSATISGEKDNLRGVIENIVLNQPVPIGTGLPGLFVKVIGKLSKKESEKKKPKKKVLDDLKVK